MVSIQSTAASSVRPVAQAIEEPLKID